MLEFFCFDLDNTRSSFTSQTFLSGIKGKFMHFQGSLATNGGMEARQAWIVQKRSLHEIFTL